ncbi:hypothetical protein AcetOrient_orf03353 [Acetobacter orientalis]|uniref:Uncharacterized protein n=1 Tax=Acetobacter orientalis TaxID=146474 RepID=A0A2Z5ZIY7_9PROT|nr:hypothetical protein AcetOrient_orf03353 [Acetobacter orientalis]
MARKTPTLASRCLHVSLQKGKTSQTNPNWHGLTQELQHPI